MGAKFGLKTADEPANEPTLEEIEEANSENLMAPQ